MSFVIGIGLVLALIAAIALPLHLAFSTSVTATTLLRISFLWIAGILSGLMTLAILAAAAWGMDTRIPYGLGVYPYLIPALSLPAFLLLRFASLPALSRTLWFLTAACAVAWYFGDRADRIASGMRPISNPTEIFGIFFNAFTILFLIISVLVQFADVCRRREQNLTKTQKQTKG